MGGLTSRCFAAQSNGGSFPDKKAIAGAMAQKSELKKFMKKVMPFVQIVMDKVRSALCWD